MQDNDALLRVLVESQIEFVLIGGVAANVLGSSYSTQDLDVLAPLSVENCEKILRALMPFNPRFYQTLGAPKVTRTAAELAEFKNLYFKTDLGKIDLLGALPPVGSFVDVAARAQVFTVFGHDCRVVSLDDLIAVKAFVGRPKDKFVELELRAIRERLKAGPVKR